MKRSIIYFIILLVLSACRKDPEIPVSKEGPPVYDIVFRVPENWPAPKYNFEQNNLSEAGFRLGRKLFFEPKLSRDNTISCGSCHQQFAAFAHSAHSVSHGIEGLLGNRNAPGLFNLNWHNSFMHDGGVIHIELQPLAPIANPVEMDESLARVISKLNADPVYRQMFSDAFGDTLIDSQRMLKAIAQFQGMLVSAGSKYDKYVRGEAEFSEMEKKGFELFSQKNCNTCHIPPLFSDFSFRSNGLGYNVSASDSGRAHITGYPSDRNKFKVPSLRNIMVTGPYMHDGRFKTIGQCLEHYNSGIQQVENLDEILKQGIPLSQVEKQQLTAFLETLTDDGFLKDPRFADPN